MWKTAPLPDCWRDLFALTTTPDEAFTESFVALGEPGARAAMAVLDPHFEGPHAPERTEVARFFAAHLLGRMRRADTVPDLFRALARTADADGALVQAVALALIAFGPDIAHEACVRFAASAPGDPVRPWLAEIAASCGARNEEVRAVLAAWIREEPTHGSTLAAATGDPEYVPVLLATFDAEAGSDEVDPLVLFRLGDVVRQLGGDLGDARARIWTAVRATAARQEIAARRERIERRGFDIGTELPAPDDRCPCLSERPYRECCAALEAELFARGFHHRRGPSPLGAPSG